MTPDFAFVPSMTVDTSLDSNCGSAKTQAALNFLSFALISLIRSAPGKTSGETVIDPDAVTSNRFSKYW